MPEEHLNFYMAAHAVCLPAPFQQLQLCISVECHWGVPGWHTTKKKACRSSVETEWLLKINLLMADATHHRPISAKDILAEVTFHLENPKALL